ncbi:helix-turn-helix domain-containing protein [Sporolactobacillus shoreicorticis]|uniref:Helix-turn-helix domain-containing protein n=1 Tax=Sporolactobacillus shoreicorticis TaxID=1923877 RepID=A0ABW5S3T6_9BACL|nr:helix-turn-helix domain-containing protein [Sporolactobacillus shoreicorticis]MCO7124336.1 helix-turn-helix domain-containing protein [Sporolactobacillus shoreicorticis]
MNKSNSEIIRQKLSDLTLIEKEQKENGIHIPDIPFSSTRISNDRLEFLNNFFFKKQDLYISKHNRFAAYPLHSHQFTELNYMLSGSCQQVIDGKPITLKQGQLLLIGVGTSHEIKPLGENDLLINILFNRRVVTVEWLNQMKNSHSPLIQYLFDLALNRGNTAVHFLFDAGESKKIQSIIKNIINEYYAAEVYSSTISSLYLPILFTTLAREIDQTQKSNAKTPEKMVPVLRLIEDNYKDLNLTRAAAQLGYNKTYLGNLIKKTMGITFTQLIIKRRLYQARLLLNTTDLPISDIAQESGFSNKTYFYKVFKDRFGYLPGEEKRRQRSFK